MTNKDIYTTIHNRLFAYLDGRSKSFLLVLNYAIVLLLGYVDYLTGDYSLILFYVIPVFLGSWFVDKRSGIFICIACSLASFLNKSLDHPGASLLLHSWDLIIESSYLLLLSLMFSTLRHKLEQEKMLARLDPLTRSLNRRYLYEMAELEINRSSRYGRPFTIAYIDLDNFKTINDRQGHHVGDELLCTVVETIRENIRCTDMVARIGGDEFVIMLTETGAEHSIAAITKLQEKLAIAMENRQWPVTFSIGMVTYDTPPGTVDEMLKKADHMMYAVKSGQKNAIRHEIVTEPVKNRTPYHKRQKFHGLRRRVQSHKPMSPPRPPISRP